MIRTAVAISVLLGCVSAQANSPLWVDVGGSSDRASVFIDTANIRFISPRVIEAWVLFDMKAPEPGPDAKNYLSQEQLTRFECISGRYAMVAMTTYPDHRGVGIPIQTWDAGDTALTFQHKVPGSVMDAVMELICALKQPK